MSRRIATAAAVLCVSVFVQPSSARLVGHKTLKDLEAADVLAVAEVREVTTVGEIPKEQTRWNTPILRRRSQLRILRAFGPRGTVSLAADQVITLETLEVDWEHCGGLMDGPMFPGFKPGQISVFPLKRKPAAGPSQWELIDEEDFNLIVPAVRKPLNDEAPADGTAFIKSELAAALASGDYATIVKAGGYLQSARSDGKGSSLALAREIAELVERTVQTDEQRWLTIAAACYASMPLQSFSNDQASTRPSVAALRGDMDPLSGPAVMVKRALSHVSRKDLDRRFITETIANMEAFPWGAAVTLGVNYPTDPAAMKQLGAALDKGAAGAVYVAQRFVKTKEHPLVPRALAAATKLLTRTPAPEFTNLRAACELIRDYGDDRAFTLLLEEIRKAQKADRKRYMELWQSCAYSKSPRAMTLCRIAIEDPGIPGEQLPISYRAAGELQRVTGADLGVKSDPTPTERENTIHRAKALLATRPA